MTVFALLLGLYLFLDLMTNNSFYLKIAIKIIIIEDKLIYARQLLFVFVTFYLIFGGKLSFQNFLFRLYFLLPNYTCEAVKRRLHR